MIWHTRRRTASGPGATGARIFAADSLPADAANSPGGLNRKMRRTGRSLRGEGRRAAFHFEAGRLLLTRPHLGIDAAAGQELAMVAALDDAAVIEDEDLVGVDNRGQAMRDD